MRVLLTGASGFVGRALLTRLVLDPRFAVTAAVRRAAALPTGAQGREIVVGEVSARTDWSPCLAGVEVVLHLAARAHVLREAAAGAQAAYLDCNTAGTLNLAQQATRAGVRRFVFVSTVGVHGNLTPPGRPWREDQAFSPWSDYTLSKVLAEEGLVTIARDSGMELVRVRPPLVYGPGVKGNFRVLLDGVRRRVPLPLACVSNARSLVGIDNLVDMLLRCIDHPRASGRAFFASDGEDVSTPELIRRLSAAMGRSNPLLWPVPEAMLRAGMLLAGREATFDRVCGTLQIDISAARGALGWQPPVSMDEGLKRMVARS